MAIPIWKYVSKVGLLEPYVSNLKYDPIEIECMKSYKSPIEISKLSRWL